MREWKRVGIVAAAMLLLGGACAPTADEEQHHYGEWTVTEEATCTGAGERRRICVDSGCGKVEYEVIPATGHSWGDWETMTEATCAERGSHRHFCSVCGEAETEAIPATGKHVYGEWRGDDRGHWRSCLYCGHARGRRGVCLERGPDVYRMRPSYFLYRRSRLCTVRGRVVLYGDGHNGGGNGNSHSRFL